MTVSIVQVGRLYAPQSDHPVCSDFSNLHIPAGKATQMHWEGYSCTTLKKGYEQHYKESTMMVSHLLGTDTGGRVELLRPILQN